MFCDAVVCVYREYVDEVLKIIAPFSICNSSHEILCLAVKFTTVRLRWYMNNFEADGSSIMLDLDKEIFSRVFVVH